MEKKTLFKKNIKLILTLLSFYQIAQASPDTDKGLLPELKLDSKNEEANSDTAFKSEVMISKTENNAIESLKKIIKKMNGKPEEADLSYRLAEMYMRRAKSGRFFEMTEGGNAKLRTYGVDSAQATEQLKMAIDIYNRIEKDHPKYKNLDSVLFNSALAHSQTKQIARAGELYEKLITQFPKSSVLPDALLEAGELLYHQGKFEEALQKFLPLEKYPHSKAYPYGLYKSAWAYYNLKQTEPGVKQLVHIVKNNPPSSGERKYNLRQEALRDLTLFIGETTPPNQLFTFFKSITTEDELGEIIINLATLYESHSRYKEISIFANEYIAVYPTNEHTSKIFIKLIDAEETLKNRNKVIANLKSLGDNCQLQVLDQQKVCKDDFRKVSLEISKKWWEIWLKNKNHVEFSKLTEQSFEILLSQDDPANPDSGSRYAYAELLFQLGKFDLAEKNYEEVSLNKKLDKTKQHDALYGALFSIEKQLDNSKEDKTQENILTLQQQTLASRYVKEFPNGEHFDSLQYKLAFFLYKQQNYDEALKSMISYIKSTKNRELKTKAEDIVLDIYNVKNDYKAIMTIAGMISKNTITSERKKKIDQIYLEAHYSQVEKQSENIEIEKKIDLLKQFALQHKDTKLGQDSFWKCVSLAYANGLEVAGADLSLEYAKTYPQDKRNLDSTKEATKAYVEAGHLNKAISTFRDLAKLEPQKFAQHMESSCDLLRVNSQLPEARGCYKALFDSADKVKKAELLTKLMKSFGDKKNQSELESVENQILENNIEPYATQLLVAKARKLFDSHKISEAFNLSVKLNSRPVDADVRAEARLIQAFVLEKEFTEQSVKAKESKFATVLAAKTEKFDKAYTAFSTTVKMSKSDKIQTEALQGIDRIYAHFIEALTTMPIPSTLAEEEKTALRQELIKITNPFQDKRKDNLAKLRQISKLSTSNSEDINWADYSLEKTIIPRVHFPETEKISFFLPNSFDNIQVSQNRLPASEKSCDLTKTTAQSIGGCIQTKKLAEAEKIALKLTETKAQRSVGLYYLSILADMAGQKDKALWMIQKANSIDEFSSVYHFQYGKVLYSVDGLNSALPHFEKALGIKSSSKDLSVMYGLKSYSDKDYISATEEFSQLSNEELYTFNVAVLYVESTVQKGDTEKAIQLAQNLVNADSKNVDMLIEQARIYEEFALKKEEAMNAYTKALGLASQPDQKDWLKRKIEYLKTNKGNAITANLGS